MARPFSTTRNDFGTVPFFLFTAYWGMAIVLASFKQTALNGQPPCDFLSLPTNPVTKRGFMEKVRHVEMTESNSLQKETFIIPRST